MKIKPEHYAYLRDAILATAPDHAVLERAKTEKQIRWNLFWAAGISQWVCDHIYKYSHDEHIDTALRQIVAELDQQILRSN